MDQRMKNLMGGPGICAALALCILAVGAGGYFLLQRDDAAPQTALRPEAQEPAVSPVREEQPEHTPVVETVPMEEPEEVPVSMPEAAVDDTPVAAEAPHVVVTPLQGDVVAAFSVDALVYDETMDDWRTHDGVDIAAAEGEAVLSACAGTVLSVTDDVLMGTTVVVAHAGGYETTYANLQPDPPVAEGDQVSAGQILGAVGTSAAAEAAQGPHLHFAVTMDGAAVDPDTFLEQ